MSAKLKLCVCDDILYPVNGAEDGQDWVADCRATPCYADDLARRWNAYPQLVAALRDLWRVSYYANSPDEMEAASALLRSLGEEA